MQSQRLARQAQSRYQPFCFELRSRPLTSYQKYWHLACFDDEVSPPHHLFWHSCQLCDYRLTLHSWLLHTDLIRACTSSMWAGDRREARQRLRLGIVIGSWGQGAQGYHLRYCTFSRSKACWRISYHRACRHLRTNPFYSRAYVWGKIREDGRSRSVRQPSASLTLQRSPLHRT